MNINIRIKKQTKIRANLTVLKAMKGSVLKNIMNSSTYKYLMNSSTYKYVIISIGCIVYRIETLD